MKYWHVPLGVQEFHHISVALKQAFIPRMYENFDHDISDNFSKHSTHMARMRYGIETDGLAHAMTDYLMSSWDFCKRYWDIGGLRVSKGYAIPLRFLRQAAEVKLEQSTAEVSTVMPSREGDISALSMLVTAAVAIRINSQKAELTEALQSAIPDALAAFLQQMPGWIYSHSSESMDVDLSVMNAMTSSTLIVRSPMVLRADLNQHKPAVELDLKKKLQELYLTEDADFKSTYQEELVTLTCTNYAYVVGVLPTGGGKSLVFELPPSYEGSKTVVLCPFVSLLDDMLCRAEKLNVRAIKWNQKNQGRDQDRLLFVPLETYTSPGFLT
jgi:hypothetical protein